MKPFKSGAVIAAWLLRITILFFVYEHFFKGFPGFDLKSFTFYVHSLYILSSVLLLVGGLIQKPALTVLAGLVIFVLPIVQLIHFFPKDILSDIMLYLLPLSAGFYFFTAGNGN